MPKSRKLITPGGRRVSTRERTRQKGPNEGYPWVERSWKTDHRKARYGGKSIPQGPESGGDLGPTANNSGPSDRTETREPPEESHGRDESRDPKNRPIGPVGGEISLGNIPGDEVQPTWMDKHQKTRDSATTTRQNRTMKASAERGRLGLQGKTRVEPNGCETVE